MKERLTDWMIGARPGARIHFRKFPGSTEHTEFEFYEKGDDNRWRLYGEGEQYAFTEDSFNDEEDDIFFRKEPS